MVPDTIRPDTDSAAERRLFDSLRDRTDDAYIAYHHVAWLVPGERAPRQGEADFVIAHPKLGVAILEVKGGAIRFDAASGKWHSGPHELKTDPFDQARRSSFVLVDSLARVTGLSRAQVRVGYGRSEEHTSELQSLAYLVCRLLLEKKKKKTQSPHT